MSTLKDVKKVVLAYSGGLDTSIILKWLQTELGAEVVTFTADLGQGGELEPARRKAEMLGIKDIRVMDLREEFVKPTRLPMEQPARATTRSASNCRPTRSIPTSR
jgi:argininosuccinate synthase